MGPIALIKKRLTNTTLQSQIRLNSMHTTVRVPLTILEVVVSICPVAISIDMAEVVTKSSSNTSLLFLSIQKKSSGQVLKEWEASPKVGGLVEPCSTESETPTVS